MQPVLEIPGDIREAMIRHAIAGLPKEACGLLAGTDGRAERFYPMTNADDSADTYRLDPKEHLEVFDEIEGKGWELVGIFHSHPRTEAYPSATDRRLAFYPDSSYVLVSLAGGEPVLRAFTIRDDGVAEREVSIT